MCATSFYGTPSRGNTVRCYCFWGFFYLPAELSLPVAKKGCIYQESYETIWHHLPHSSNLTTLQMHEITVCGRYVLSRLQYDWSDFKMSLQWEKNCFDLNLSKECQPKRNIFKNIGTYVLLYHLGWEIPPLWDVEITHRFIHSSIIFFCLSNRN